MPGFFPRLKRLFASGFGYIAFLMAQIYAVVRLLPTSHPYLLQENIGKYGIHHVIAQAANNLVFNKKNIDQIVIFGLLLLGIVLLGMQILMLAFSLFSGVAFALPPAGGLGVFAGFFSTPNPQYDVAFILMDQVFGVPDFFNSCIAQSQPCALGTGEPIPSAPFPWPFHIALHQMFRFYSMGMLIIGTLIFLYFIVVVVAETATSGTPFGQRFQNIWVPIRLIVAIGLLVPLPIQYAGGGTTAAYNSGQYITFFAARLGSSLATNGWRIYNSAIFDSMGGENANPLGEQENLIAFPQTPDAAVISEMMSIVHTCVFTHHMASEAGKTGTGPGTIEQAETNPIGFLNDTRVSSAQGNVIYPYLVKEPQNWANAPAGSDLEFLRLQEGTDYNEALNFYARGDIIIRFGEQNETLYPEETGNVNPTCGEIRIPVGDKRLQAGPELGSVQVQALYFEIIKTLWFTRAWAEEYLDFAGRMTLKNDNRGSRLDQMSPCRIGCAPQAISLPACGNNPDSWDDPCALNEPTAEWKEYATTKLQELIDERLLAIWQAYNQNGQEFEITQEILAGNWGNAGTWFPIIAQVNGAFTDSFLNAPQMYKYPQIMEKVRDIRKTTSPYLSPMDMFNPSGVTTGVLTYEDIGDNFPTEKQAAAVLSRVFDYWNEDQKSFTNMDKILKGGGIEDAINLIFGTNGLSAMTSTNMHVHPLAQLTSLGKGLVESSIRNVAISTMSAALGGALKAMEPAAGPMAEAFSGFMTSTAFIGLSAGLVLFYIVPFLPFVYFYFAVASWVKTIFEAMVGVPLWALAHLRLDGDGLPGEAASNGYFLIFEIFIRPILTIFGLIAAMLIFGAQARILNIIWQIVSSNVGGFTDGTLGAPGLLEFQRPAVDEFFFTIIYAIIMYMAATSAFKLIDSIPDNILRWMGASVSSFGDINQDPAEGLTQYAALGGITAGQQAVGGVNKLSSGLGGALGNLGK